MKPSNKLNETIYHDRNGYTCFMYIQRTKKGYWALRYYKYHGSRPCYYFVGDDIFIHSGLKRQIQIVGKFDNQTEAMLALTNRKIRVDNYFDLHATEIKYKKLYRDAAYAVTTLNVARHALEDDPLLEECFDAGFKEWKRLRSNEYKNSVLMTYLKDNDLMDFVDWMKNFEEAK